MYYFTAGGERWACWPEGNDLRIEETRKNGQEDCHVAGYAELEDGRLVLESGFVRRIGMYMRRDTAQEMQDFLDKHGPPKDGV